jgi:ABC-2 type transport system ATP-binding protein
MATRSSGVRSPRRLVAATAALITVLAACSSSSKTSSPTSSRPSSTSAPGAVPVANATCRPPAGGPVTAAPVPGVASDRVITSVDGAQIHVHWFPVPSPPAHGAPTILMGPGWGSGGDTNTTASGSQGIVSIKDLRDAGYNVLTWDPRGFGASTGTIEVDSAPAEGRDVERIIDWLSAQSGVELDGPRDPRVGMVGASYGGGIQITTAAIDCRVDAILPSWAWNSLTTSLYKSATVKSGWATFLYAVAAGRKLDPHIVSANRAGIATGVLGAADAQWFAERGPGLLVNQIRVPTLFVQGTVDTLFTLDEAVRNYEILRSHGVPTAMIWFCGGHGVCLTNPGDRARVAQRTLLWLARYVKRDAAVDAGPGFELVDQNGKSFSAAGYPVDRGIPITADGHGRLLLSPAGGAGPAHPPADNPDLLAHLVGPITPAKAANAVNVTITARVGATVVGAPQLRLTYEGGVKTHTRPTRVFAQLVDATSGLVLGNQITPIDVTLDGHQHVTTVPLEMVAYTATAGAHLVLQIVATTVAYAQPQLGGFIDVTAQISLPVATNLTAR